MGRERRRHRNRTTRLLAFIDTFTEATALGLKEHDRPALARDRCCAAPGTGAATRSCFRIIHSSRSASSVACLLPRQIPRYCRLTDLEPPRHRWRQIHQWCRTVRDTGSPRRLIGRVTQFQP
ncbi:DUF1612 domain-containing protein [Mesorhizobium sp. M0898]|uniref:DUF1612 domain-containing protein n=1 Tax=Mesorhizobium sp. M0898 TaxID=2957020 RepID=UPI00333D2459